MKVREVQALEIGDCLLLKGQGVDAHAIVLSKHEEEELIGLLVKKHKDYMHLRALSYAEVAERARKSNKGDTFQKLESTFMEVIGQWVEQEQKRSKHG